MVMLQNNLFAHTKGLDWMRWELGSRLFVMARANDMVSVKMTMVFSSASFLQRA